MARNDHPQLFPDPDPPRRPRVVQPELTTPDGLVPDEEGLFARKIHGHSIEKASKVHRFADIVSVAVGGKLPVYWVELFAGPGRLYVVEDKKFLLGSPMAALGVRAPFQGYFFSDLSADCGRCLRVRTQGMEGVHVHCGDANSTETLDAVFRAVPRNALVIAYLDPQGLDLHLDTVRALAWHYRRLDLLINLPVNGLIRYLAAGNEEKARPVLGHPDPQRLMDHGINNATRELRGWYHGQLASLGYTHRTADTIRLADKKAALYDLIVAGRHKLTVELFERATEIGAFGQRQLGLVPSA
ncbi:MAG: three-Cys-motif partner protein TcmP [Thermoleophilaceae bacterium]